MQTRLVSRMDIDEGIRQQMAMENLTPFISGKTRIPLNVPTYGPEEVIEALDSLMSTWVTMGKNVKRFEEMFAAYVGMRYGVMTNSGSSANLLALSLITLDPGDEVIAPALTWSTTIFPIAQAGGSPVLVDVDRETYNISPEAIERAITPRTRAIMPVHLLGNPCDMDAIMGIAKRHHLFIIEDCCEAHGAEYRGQKVGSFGAFSTYSFFFSHHISTIEGGMVLAREVGAADKCRSMRAHGWIRDMSNRDEIAAANPDIDQRFMFAYPGYNFRPTEIQGAFGIHQLPRLDELVGMRRQQARYFTYALSPHADLLQLPVEAPNTKHSYFAYPITIRDGAPFTKKELVTFLEGKGLETRPIEGSNMAIQPAMKYLKFRTEDLTNTEYIHDHSFFFGLHQGLGMEQQFAIVSYFDEFMGRYA